MPLRQSFPLRQQAIGTGVRQPFEGWQILAGEFDAVRLIFETTFVVTALTGFDVQLTAGNVGEIDFIRVFIHQFMQAALPAAIAQRFPLGVSHFVESFALPER